MTTACTVAAWTAFGTGTVASSATLSGLVFVAVSINLSRIVAHPSLPTRSWQTMGLLLTPYIVGFFLLVPRQSRAALAWELIVSAVFLGGTRVALHHQAVRSEKANPLPLVGRLAGFLTALLPALVIYACMAVAGGTLLEQSGGGLYWLVPGCLIAIFFGLINAWALLVALPV